jgi:hypothetical protein
MTVVYKLYLGCPLMMVKLGVVLISATKGNNETKGSIRRGVM